jgi:hypothetical protein
MHEGVEGTDEVVGFEGRIVDDGFESEAYEIDRSRNNNCKGTAFVYRDGKTA